MNFFPNVKAAETTVAAKKVAHAFILDINFEAIYKNLSEENFAVKNATEHELKS
jgi:hypothetical protein